MMSVSGAFPLAILLVLGCGRDPILEAADDLQGGPHPAAGGGSPPRGDPVQPAPGDPESPPPGRASAPPPGVPEQPPPGGRAVVAGPKVTLSGQVVLADYDMGTVRIDIFDGDQKNLNGPRPMVVAVLELERPGSFEVQVPASTPKVWLGAYVDENLDGRPGPQDPSGWYTGNPVDTEGGAEGIVIQLQRQPPPPQKGL